MAQFTNQAQLSYNGTVVNSNVAVGELRDVLTVDKNAVSQSYNAGDDVTYAISIVNSGSTAFTGLTVTDDLGAYTFNTTDTRYPLTYNNDSVRYYVNGILQAAPTVSAQNGVVFSGINIPAGGNALIIYSARVNEYAPLGIGSSVTNTAVVTGTGISDRVSSSYVLNAEAAPDLTITKSIDPVPVSENGTVTYTFVIQNRGSAEAGADSDVVLNDTFDPILSGISVSLNGTQLSESDGYEYDEADGVFTTTSGTITVPAATYAQDSVTGAWSVTPGVTTLVVTGTI